MTVLLVRPERALKNLMISMYNQSVSKTYFKNQHVREAHASHQWWELYVTDEPQEGFFLF